MKSKLSELCNYVKEKIPVADIDNKHYVSTENMIPDKGGITTASTLPTAVKTQAFQKGDILVSNIRPYFKKIWLAEYRGGCSNDVLVFRAKASINVEYLYYILSDDAFFAYTTQTSKGTKMPRGDKQSIMEYSVPSVNLELQRKIGFTLRVIDDKIFLNQKINDNLEQQAKSLVDAYLYNLKECSILKLSDVADCQNGRAFYKEGYDLNGALVVDLGNVNLLGNFIRTSADKFITIERYSNPKLEKYRLYKNDLVMVMTDRKSTMELLGKTGKISSDGYYLLNQRMYRIRAKDGMNINYLYAYLNSTVVSDYLKSQALGSVQKYVNTGSINDIQIKLPSPEQMEELAAMLDPIYAYMENNIIENENLVQLRDAILPKLISGEIDVEGIEL